MTELRAADPTLDAMTNDQVVWLDGTKHPQVAHNLACLKEDDDRPEQFLWRSLSVDAARWFAVPCRECFPDAPPPGHSWTCRDCDIKDCPGHYAQSFLSWQIAVENTPA